MSFTIYLRVQIASVKEADIIDFEDAVNGLYKSSSIDLHGPKNLLWSCTKATQIAAALPDLEKKWKEASVQASEANEKLTSRLMPVEKDLCDEMSALSVKPREIPPEVQAVRKQIKIAGYLGTLLKKAKDSLSAFQAFCVQRHVHVVTANPKS